MLAARLREHNHRRARAVNTAHRLRTQRATTQNTFHRLSSTLRSSGLPTPTFDRLRHGRPGTLFAARTEPASSRTWALLARLAPQTSLAQVLPNALELRCQIPFDDFCNRPVVTSTHQCLDSRAWCLRTSDLRFTHRPDTHALAHAGHGEIHFDVRSPLPAILTPGGAAVGRRSHQLQPVPPSR